MDIIKCLKSFFRINERAKRIVATILCVSLVMVDTLPYYAENLFDDVANDAVTNFADTLVSTPSSAEEENEIVDEDIDEIGDKLFGDDPTPPDDYFYLTYTYATRSEATPSEFIDVTKELLVKKGDTITFPTLIDFENLPMGRRHFLNWNWDSASILGFSDLIVSNGGMITAAQTNEIYAKFIEKGYIDDPSTTPPTYRAKNRRVSLVSKYFSDWCRDEDLLTVLTPTIDDYYGIDISEIPDEAKVDGKYAIYFYYEKDLLGHDISNNPIVATYGTEINFPIIDTSHVIEGYTFEGWTRDDIIIGSGGTLTAEQSKICTGVGTDKFVIFEAKINVPELHTVHFDIDEEYYADVIPPITNATLSVIKFPSLPNQLRGVEIASWKSSDGVYSYAPGIEVNFSALDWANTNDHYFTPVYNIKDINVHFKNELPPTIPGTIPASRSDVIVKVNQLNPNEYQEYKIPGYKHEGWGLSSDGEIVIEVDEDNIEPLRFIKAGQLSYDMYPIFLPNGERPVPAPEEPKKRRYFGSGGGSGGGTYYSDGASSGIFEFDPLLNKFKCYIFDKNNNKQYVVNDWFKIIDKKDGKAYWYLTDATGCMVTGWTLCDGVFYYFSESVSDYGMMANGTYNINGKEYVFTSDGRYVGDANLIPKVYNIVNRNIVANMSDTEVSAFNDTEVFAFADTEIFAFSGTEPTKPFIDYYDKDNKFIASDDGIYYNNYKQRFEFFVDSYAPIVNNQTFEGWEVIDSEETQPKLYTNEMKLGTNKSWKFRAKYRLEGYIVNYFISDYGAVYNTDYVDISTTSLADDNYTISNVNTPTKEGYNLVGFDDNVPATTAKYHIGDTIAIHQNLNLYPVWQRIAGTQYILDIKTGYDDDYDKTKEYTEKDGYMMVGCDLNDGAGGAFIYLGVKYTTDPVQAIRGFITSSSSKDYIDYNGIRYYHVKAQGSSSSVDSKPVDLNKGAGGSYIYLYYTKDERAGTPIMSLNSIHCQNKTDASFFNRNGWDVVREEKFSAVMDINDGCNVTKRPNCRNLYIIYKREGDVVGPNPGMDIRYVRGNNWMAKIPGNRLITHINTPGTHESGTSKIALAKSSFAKCQDLQINEQLNIGIRFLDCRLGCDGSEDSIIFYHGDTHECTCYEKLGVPLKYRKVLEWCIDFVSANPTETIFMRLQHESRSKKFYQQGVNSILAKYASTNRLYMPKTSDIPTLDKVRGKVVIIDRNPTGETQLDYGLDFNITEGEDHDGDNAQEKIEHLKGFFAENYHTDIDKLKKNVYYLVHTSCHGYIKGTMRFMPQPEAMAIGYWGFREWVPGVNPWFLKECSLIRGRYCGTISMDFVTQEMAEKVYMTNFK